MAFIGRVVQYPGRVRLTSASDGEGNPIENTYDMTRVEGTVYTEGTPLNPDSLNAAIAEAVEAALVPVTGTINYQVNFTAYTGDANQVPTLKRCGSVVNFYGAFSYTGTATTPGTTYTQVASIPAGFRPAKTLNFICPSNSYNLWMLRVTSGGAVSMTRLRDGSGAAVEMNSNTWLGFSASWIAG